MKPLNYLREAKQYLPKKFKLDDDANKLLAMASRGVKFILPENGKILESGFPEPEYARLPYSVIVLEYPSMDEEGTDHKIVIAQELDENRILVQGITEDTKTRGWLIVPGSIELQIDKGGYEIKAISGYDQKNANWHSDLSVELIPMVYSLMELLQALSCSNIVSEKIPADKSNRLAKQRGVKPYDEYHILTVIAKNKASTKENLTFSGERNSPREHLRRGHIRTLASGLKIWIQSMVINAGVGGKITKDYSIKPKK